MRAAKESSFKESVLIPKDRYEQMKRRLEMADFKNLRAKTGILRRKDIHPELKMKMYDKQQRDKSRARGRKRGAIDTDGTQTQELLRLLPPLRQNPLLKKIIKQYVDRYVPNEIDWHPKTQQMIIDGKRIAGGNIVRSLMYLVSPESMNNIAPPGVDVLRSKLLSIGVPKSWIAYVPSATVERKIKRKKPKLYLDKFPSYGERSSISEKPYILEDSLGDFNYGDYDVKESDSNLQNSSYETGSEGTDDDAYAIGNKEMNVMKPSSLFSDDDDDGDTDIELSSENVSEEPKTSGKGIRRTNRRRNPVSRWTPSSY